MLVYGVMSMAACPLHAKTLMCCITLVLPFTTRAQLSQLPSSETVFQLDKMKENRLCCNYDIGFVLLDWSPFDFGSFC